MQHYNQGYDELYHYGVMGMKWGHHRYTEGRLARAKEESASAKKLATGYTNSLNNRLAKKPDSVNRQSDVIRGTKLANAYTKSMDNKVDRIQSKLDSQKSKKIGPVGSTLVKGTASLHKGLAKIDRSAANASKRDAESIRSQKDQMLALTKNGKPLFSEKDVDNMIKAYDSQANKSESKAKKHERYAKQLLSELGQIKMKDIY